MSEDRFTRWVSAEEAEIQELWNRVQYLTAENKRLREQIEMLQDRPLRRGEMRLEE